MRRFYALGGCRVESPVDLPGLPLLPEGVGVFPSISLRMGELPVDPDRGWFLEEDSGGSAISRFRRWTDGNRHAPRHRLRYDYRNHWVQFVFASDGSEIEIAASPQVRGEHLATLISGPILGRSLRLRGTFCLHGTSIQVDHGAFAFLGPSRAGKSTFAAALADAGGHILSDDLTPCVRMGDGFGTLPGQRGLRLWGDARKHLRAAAGRPMWPGIEEWEKVVVPLPTLEGSDPLRPTPLLGLFVLERHEESLAAPRITDCHAAERPFLLSANIYGSLEPSREQRAAEFKFFSELAGAVPIRRLRVPRGLEGLRNHAESFLETLKAA